jgi:uncharacterized protein (TIGR03437 family)
MNRMLNRRRALALLGGAGAVSLAGRMGEEQADAASTCTPLAGAQTEGPYWVDELLNRSDIRIDPSDGSMRPGTLLALTINLQEVSGAACGPLAGARVDIWHCDAAGTYSDEAANNSVGKKFLRGYQVSDDSGTVKFTTIYPGWYSARTVHIHVRIRTYSGSTLLDNFTAQIFFDDAITDQAFTQAPYSQRRARDTRNSSDMVVRGTTNGIVVYASVTQNSLGYAATANIGVNVKMAAAKPVVAGGGVVNAAGYQAGVAPGAWISIFGQNLAASTRVLTATDLVNGNLPNTLGGVSVQIGDQAAFMDYISPTQINVQAPALSGANVAQVVVSTAGGASDAVAAALQPILPAFFASQSYVAAVRADGVLITGIASTASGTTSAAKPGDLVSLFGTGFGATTPDVAPGLVGQTAAPLINDVTITIGGAPAIRSFAGLSAAGLYQFNITVPGLSDGDHEVIARIAGQVTPSGILLKIQNASAANHPRSDSFSEPETVVARLRRGPLRLPGFPAHSSQLS